MKIEGTLLTETINAFPGRNVAAGAIYRWRAARISFDPESPEKQADIDSSVERRGI